MINSRNPDPRRGVNPGPDRPGLAPFPVDPLDLTDEFREARFCAQAWWFSNIYSENGVPKLGNIPKYYKWPTISGTANGLPSQVLQMAYHLRYCKWPTISKKQQYLKK